MEARSFNTSDETRAPDKTKLEIVRTGHVGVLQSGAMRVVHDDGTEREIGPGHAYAIQHGHDDAWVVVDEPGVGFEFESQTAEEFAKGS